MDITRAYLVLGAQPSDSWEIVKRKYRQMMLQYHPDTQGDDEASVYLAQQINEAYAVVKKHLSGDGVFRSPSEEFTENLHGMHQSRRNAWESAFAGGSEGFRKRPTNGAAGAEPFHWETGENPQAYCRRLVYEGTGMYDAGEVLWKERTQGRYNWDPYKEDFQVYARSVNEACTELLGIEERRFGYYDREELPDPSLEDAYRQQIFHLLMQQFVLPGLCLDRIAQEHERDEAVKGKYAFDCAAGLRGAQQMSVLAHIQNGDMLQLGMDGERMIVLTREGLRVGHISFHEDSLYYIVSLLLRMGGAVMEPQVRQIRQQRRTRPMTAHISLRLHVKLQDETEQKEQLQKMTAAGNRRIAALLAEYREELEWR